MNLHIPEPCHEDWNKMTPNDQGSFCAKCCKTVVDFTTKTAEEIRAYLQAKAGQKTCGRFRPDQLTPPSPRFSFRTRRFAAALWLVFGALLFTSCHKKDHPVPTGKMGRVGYSTLITPPESSMSASVAPDSPVQRRAPGTDTVPPEMYKVGEIAPPPDTVKTTKPVKPHPKVINSKVKVAPAQTKQCKTKTPPNDEPIMGGLSYDMYKKQKGK